MKAPAKRVGRAPSKNNAATAAKLTKINSEQAIVEHLRRLSPESSACHCSLESSDVSSWIASNSPTGSARDIGTG
jgi:hypothetical protein